MLRIAFTEIIIFSAPEASSREKLAELAYQLEGPMQLRADQLKQYLAHSLAPATRKVKEVHNALEQKADVTFGCAYIVCFDDLGFLDAYTQGWRALLR